MSLWDDRPIRNQRPNQHLIMQDDDDAASEDDYARRSPRRGALIPPSRPGPGLIEEEPEREALGNTGVTKWPLGADYQPSWPYTAQGKSARQMFHKIRSNRAHNAAAANSWTRTGQQTRNNVSQMFGESSSYDHVPLVPPGKQWGSLAKWKEQGKKWGKSLFSTQGHWFKSLFGDKASNFHAKKREDFNALNPTVKDRWNARRGAGKLSWMERLFGARKKKILSAKAMGIESTNAPVGESSGWADQLIEASKAGRLDEGSDMKEAFESGVSVSEEAKPDAQQEPSDQPYDEEQESEKEEEFTPTSSEKGKGSYLNAQQADYDEDQKSVDYQGIDPDKGIDESDDEEDEAPEGKAMGQAFFQQYLKNLVS